MQNDMKRIGRVIRQVREAKSLTQTVLAEKASVSHHTIVDIENGNRNPTFNVLNQIINALDIPPEYIFCSKYTKDRDK